jgi:glycosyltransferase involved in cell wall biosynthesis
VKGSSVHGISRLFSWWFPRFDSERYEVKLLGLRPPDNAMQHLLDLGIQVESLSKGKYDLSTFNALLDYVKKEEPDIIHLHGYGSANFGRMIIPFVKVKTLVHEHVTDPNFPAYQGLIDGWLSRWTDWGIAVSNSVKDFTVKKRRLPADRVEVIFNGAPLDRFNPPSKETIIREKQKLGLRPETTVVGAVGRLDEQKGFKYLIEGAAQLAGDGFDGRFVIVGDGPLMAELKGSAQQLGVENYFIFTGFCSDIRPVQAAFDIQVFPSLWEGTPLTLFEAMAMEKAIVSTNVDGLGEVLRHEENALVVAPHDPDGLAEGIARLWADIQLRERLAVTAKRDSKHYDIQSTVNQIQKVYEGLVAH